MSNVEVNDLFKKGIYQHYKGSQYEVLDLVRHSETEQWMVLYRPFYGQGMLWVRPLDMFYEKITDAQGLSVDRFKWLS